MSTASPVPRQTSPSSALPEAETRALKQQVTHRLREHRQRRGRPAEPQQELPLGGLTLTPSLSRVADSVAARFAKSMSYRDFLQQQAETAVEQAEAAAQVARRNAEAIATAQQELLQEIESWSAAAGTGQADPCTLHVVEVHSAEGTGQTMEAAPAGQAVHGAAETSLTAPESSVSSALRARAEGILLQAEAHEPAVPIPANLIEFPRQLVAARRARPRLAEGPLREEADAAPERAQLRIFEVEATAVSTAPTVDRVLPEWHHIRLDAPGEARPVAENPDAQTSLVLPVFVAPLALRAMAALVDGCCIAAAFLLAVAAAAYASPVLPTGLYAALTACGALMAFAVLYLLLFFTVNDATPGMRYARIGFCTFADENPTRASIRRRIFALLLAALPLGLGIVWACMDEDGLGWHDRISRMYPRAY